MFKRATLTNVCMLAYIGCPNGILVTANQDSIQAKSHSQQQRFNDQAIEKQGRKLGEDRFLSSDSDSESDDDNDGDSFPKAFKTSNDKQPKVALTSERTGNRGRGRTKYDRESLLSYFRQKFGGGSTGTESNLLLSTNVDTPCSGVATYQDADGNCQNCPTLSCTACTSPNGTCTECEPYKFLDPTDQTCKQCKDLNCQKCDATGECLNQTGLCPDKQWFHQQSQQCKNCNKSCATCDNAQTCLTCPITNMYVDQFGSCSSCAPFCSTCENGTSCLGCLDGLTLIDGKCYACDADQISLNTSVLKTEIIYTIGESEINIPQTFDRAIPVCSSPVFEITQDGGEVDTNVIKFDYQTSSLRIFTDDQLYDNHEYSITLTATKEGYQQVENTFILKVIGPCANALNSPPQFDASYNFYLQNEVQYSSSSLNDEDCQVQITYSLVDALTMQPLESSEQSLAFDGVTNTLILKGNFQDSSLITSQQTYIIKKEVADYGIVDSDPIRVVILDPCSFVKPISQDQADMFSTFDATNKRILDYQTQLIEEQTDNLSYDCDLQYSLFLAADLTPIQSDLAIISGNTLTLNPINQEYVDKSTAIILRVSLISSPDNYIDDSFSFVICSGQPATFVSTPQIEPETFILGDGESTLFVDSFQAVTSICEEQAQMTYTATLQDGSSLPEGIEFDSITQSLTYDDDVPAGEYDIVLTGTLNDQYQSSESVQFSLAVVDCTNNQIQFDPVSDKKYYITENSLEIALTYTQTLPECQTVPNISAIDPSLVSFTKVEQENQYTISVQTDDLSFNKNTVSITFSLSTVGTTNNDEISFDVLLISRCEEVIIIAPEFASSSYQLSLNEEQSISFTSAKDDSLPIYNCGQYSYKLVNEFGEEVKQNDFQIVQTNPQTLEIVGSLTLADIDPWYVNSPHTYSIIAQLGQYGSTESIPIIINIQSPCGQTQLITQSSMTQDMSTTVLGQKLTKTIPIYQDSLSVQHSNSIEGYELCGQGQQYSLYVIQNDQEIPMFSDLLYIEGDKNLVLDTSNSGYSGTYQAILRVTLVDGATLDEQFNIVIEDCVATLGNIPIIADQTYSIDDPQKIFNLDQFTFTPACSYSFTYKAQLTSGGQLPGFIGFDNNSRTFTVQTNDQLDKGIYSVRLIGTLDNTEQSSSYTDFNIDVSIDCQKDVVQIQPKTESNKIKYYLKDASLAIESIVTHTYAECPITYTFGTSLDLADIDITITPNSQDGSFTIQSDDSAYTDVTQSYTVTASPGNPSNSASISYQIDFVNRCSEAVITDPSFAQESYSGIQFDEINIQFTATTYTIQGPLQDCGDIVYTLLDDSQNPVAPDNFLQIDSSNQSNLKLVGTPTEITDDTYYLTSKLGNFGQSQPVSVQVASISPCYYTTLDTVNVQSFTVDVFTQTGYSQSIQEPLLGNAPTNVVCDNTKQELLFADTLQLVPQDLAYLENGDIKSSPQSNAYVSQTFDIVLRSYLDGFPVETNTPFQISVTECIPTIFSGSKAGDIFYNIYTPTVTTTFGEYYYLPDECFYNFEYSFIIEETLFKTSTPAVTLDEQTRTFSIYTTDPLQVGLYELTIIATLDNTIRTSHSSATINIGILNGCLQDTLSNKQSSVTPITYIIGDTPIVLDLFQQSVAGCPVTYATTNNPIVSISQETGLLTIETDSEVEADYTIIAAATSSITGSRTSIPFLVSTRIP